MGVDNPGGLVEIIRTQVSKLGITVTGATGRECLMDTTMGSTRRRPRGFSRSSDISDATASKKPTRSESNSSVSTGASIGPTEKQVEATTDPESAEQLGVQVAYMMSLIDSVSVDEQPDIVASEAPFELTIEFVDNLMSLCQKLVETYVQRDDPDYTAIVKRLQQVLEDPRVTRILENSKPPTNPPPATSSTSI
eukprot:GHVO01033033.1.p2 GENE.GHVO01033033.1~~GHVO01033033.1.p2  ORF type:complete len:194 (-),score=38.75 GHVO01033033.1:140-721(-)